MSNPNIKNILNSFLEVIEWVSNTEYQKRAWIRGVPPGTDFDETCCHFFDIGDPVLEEYKKYGITETQYHLLKKFRDQFEAFSDENNWPPDFIDMPEWTRITEMAKDVLKAFNYEK